MVKNVDRYLVYLPESYGRKIFWYDKNYMKYQWKIDVLLLRCETWLNALLNEVKAEVVILEITKDCSELGDVTT